MDKRQITDTIVIGHYQVEASKECPSFDVPGWLIENGVV
jgi:hypothetical protein